MHSILSLRSIAAILCSCVSLSLCAEVLTTPAPTASEKKAVEPGHEFSQAVLQASADASKAWLAIVDGNRYAESWEKLSTLAKLTVKKDEWIQILEKTRRPLGSVTSREVEDQRTAIDPSGMPRGDYIVMFYQTKFSHQTAYELVTLYLEDGKWAVLTYQIDTSK